MPTLPVKGSKRPWIVPTVKEGKRQTEHDNKFYHTKEWKAISSAMAIEEPLCRECKKNGRIKASSVTDHIIPIRLGGAKYDKSNLQRLCKQCHDSKSGKEAHK